MEQTGLFYCDCWVRLTVAGRVGKEGICTGLKSCRTGQVTYVFCQMFSFLRTHSIVRILLHCLTFYGDAWLLKFLLNCNKKVINNYTKVEAVYCDNFQLDRESNQRRGLSYHHSCVQSSETS